MMQMPMPHLPLAPPWHGAVPWVPQPAPPFAPAALLPSVPAGVPDWGIGAHRQAFHANRGEVTLRLQARNLWVNPNQGGLANNCLIISLLQHATGIYTSEHAQAAEEVRQALMAQFPHIDYNAPLHSDAPETACVIRYVMQRHGLNRPVIFLEPAQDGVVARFSSVLADENIEQAVGIANWGDHFEAVVNLSGRSLLEHLTDLAPPAGAAAAAPVSAPALASVAAPKEWTAEDLLPPAIVKRPLRLEQALNNAVVNHGIREATRYSLNRAYGLELGTSRPRLVPAREEHRALMARLESAPNWTRLELSLARKFFVHLESKGMLFTEDVSGEDHRRFEQLVNKHGELCQNRPALNRLFKLKLKAPIHDTSQPKLQEHRQRLRELPEELRREERKAISKFFCHLEQLDGSWSTVAAQGVLGIQKVVDDAVAQGQIEPTTHRTLNRAFKLALKEPRPPVRKPVVPEHLALQDALPNNLRPTYRACIPHLLGYIESLGTSWAALVPDQGNPVQLQLEEFVNDAIARGQIRSETRPALNSAFGFTLRARSGRAKTFPMLPEHRCLIERLPAGLPLSARRNVTRFLCHLEVIGTSWSALVKEAADQDPAG
jgi:hypothetical protein